MNKPGTSASMTHVLTAVALSSMLLCPLNAIAHDLVLVPEKEGALTVKFGHPNDWQQAEKDRLLDLKAEDGRDAGRSYLSSLKGRDKELTVASVADGKQASLLSARYDNGLWVTTTDAAGKTTYFNTTRAMMPQAKAAFAALKFAKGLYGASGDTTVYRHEVGHPIELIPQSNPADVKAGGMLKVLVKFNGKPLARAGVEVTDSATRSGEGQPKFMSDAAGIATVPIQKAGLNVISVDYDRPNDGSMGANMKALPVQKIAMIATYAFQVR